ncbi:hypothetical protein Tco_0456149 [Tanacetum coccineum]
MNELGNDGIKLSKLEINTCFINGLPKKWLSFCQSLRNMNHVKDSELASLFGKLKYKENLIDNIYDTEKKKSLTTTTLLNQEYMNDLEEEFHERALLAKSKSLSTSASKTSTVKNKGLVAKAYEWDEEVVSLDDNEMVKVKVLMALADDENVNVGKESAKNGEWVKISMRKLTTITETWLNSSNKVNQCISEQIPTQKKKVMGVDQLTEDPSSSVQKDLVFVKYSTDDIKVSIPGVERPWLSEAEGFILPNHDTGRILPSESQVKITNPSVTVTYSLATNYDLADESSVCSTLLPPLEKLADVELVFGSKTIISNLKSNSTLKAET